ncbi:MAG TPA: hypothetical protein DD388_07170 [Acidimicrobiaceae bacterium]|nr:hypothetical protein [Acidimicrobiaceae bacterium]
MSGTVRRTSATIRIRASKRFEGIRRPAATTSGVGKRSAAGEKREWMPGSTTWTPCPGRWRSRISEALEDSERVTIGVFR